MSEPLPIATIATTCTCAHLRRASRVVTQLFDEELKASGLLATQFTVLVTIAWVGSATMVRLAELLVMDRTTLTRNLKPLVRDGLVAVEPAQDQRVRLVTLTARGQDALAQAVPLWQKAQARVVERLAQEPWQNLLAGLGAAAALGRGG